MLPERKVLFSSVTQKFIMSVSGFLLVGFLVSHLAANLMLLAPTGEAYNTYSHRLFSLGVLLYVIEVALLALFAIHVIAAINFKRLSRAARPVSYQNLVTKGGPSENTLPARNMILSGIVLLVFTILHVKYFRFGPGVDEGYVIQLSGAYAGESARDLYRFVMESFQNPYMVGWYVVAMVVLGLHLKHGFWSAFQSLGILYPRYKLCIQMSSVLIAIVLAGGFLSIPLYIYLAR